MTPTLHAPCLCCGGDLCLSSVLDVWFHTDDTVLWVARGIVPPHLPQPDVQHQHEETK